MRNPTVANEKTEEAEERITGNYRKCSGKLGYF